jgi:benzoylformate decarboxylase
VWSVAPDLCVDLAPARVQALGSAEDDRYVAMDLAKPLIDFVGLARSLGVAGTRVEKASDIGPAVGKALASGGPHLVDVRIDPSFA